MSQFDWTAHDLKVKQKREREAKRLKSYWPWYAPCDTCGAERGKPCWNMHDVRLKDRRPDKRNWTPNSNAHEGRHRYTKQELAELEKAEELQRIKQVQAETTRINQVLEQLDAYTAMPLRGTEYDYIY